MTRVTFTTYCERRARLKVIWQTAPATFVILSPREQWDLHEYYRFTENVTAEELRRYWYDVKARASSLPHRAGRVYAAFTLEPRQYKPQLTRARTEGGYRDAAIVRVQGLVREKPDVRKMTKVLLEITGEATDRRTNATIEPDE